MRVPGSGGASWPESFVAWIAAALFASSWLVPMRQLPWVSFYGELCVAGALGVVALWLVMQRNRTLVIPAAAACPGLLALVPLLQWAAGQVYFFGDAIVSSLYLLALAIAMIVGANLGCHASRVAVCLTWGLVSAGTVSALLAARQFLGISILPEWMLNMQDNARPGANLLQPNNLATLLLLTVLSSLALKQVGRLSSAAFVGTAGLALGTLVITGSRSGLMAALVVLGWFWLVQWKRRVFARPGRSLLLTLIATVVLAGTLTHLRLALRECTMQVPCVSTQPIPTGLSALRSTPSLGRLVSLQTSRPRIWQASFAAIGHSWAIGYGWNQVSVAHAVAAADIAVGEFTEYSHNLALDLMVWMGVPAGALTIFLILRFVLMRARKASGPIDTLLVGALLALLVHACLELPHGYLGFLAAAGLAAGALCRSDPTTPARESKPTARNAAAMTLSLLLGVGVGLTVPLLIEYRRIERPYLDMVSGWQSALQSGAGRVEGNAVLLDHLQAQVSLMNSPLLPYADGREAQIQQSTALRFGYWQTLVKHAALQAARGDGAQAEQTLQRLCLVHGPKVCKRARDIYKEALPG